VAELGLASGDDRDRLALAAHDVAALEQRTVPLGELGVRGRRLGMLVARVGLPGQRGLVHLERLRRKDPAVARHHVAGVEHHDVAGDDLLGVHGRDLPVTPDLDLDLDPVDQPRDRHRRAVLLPPAEQAAQHDDQQDDRRVDPVAQQEREHGRGDQDEHDRLGELPPQLA
jgi:hypothetical protein